MDNEELTKRANELLDRGAIDEAAALLEPFAAEGRTNAMSLLGFIHCFLAESEDRKKIAEGAALLNEACQKGDASACHNLGTLWLGNSPNIGCDPRRAAEYYLRARELGGPVANEEFYEHWRKVLG